MSPTCEPRHTPTVAPARDGTRAALAAATLLIGLLAAACTTPTPAADIRAATNQPTPTGPSRTGGGTDLIAPDPGGGLTLPSSTDRPTVELPFPTAVALPWLKGIPTGDHIGTTVTTVFGEQWQGRIAGERALLREDGYSWFGPDGAMVGCAADGCIAVDAQGVVAVTDGPESPRHAYTAAGEPLGAYSPDGDLLLDQTDPPPLVDAIAATGVDAPGLVDTAGRLPPFAGGATGDPHLITAGGVRVTTQEAGQFVARTGDPARQIHLEFAPMLHRSDVAIVTGIAIRAAAADGSDAATVTIDTSATVTIDGKRVSTAESVRGAVDHAVLPSGVELVRFPAGVAGPATVALVWPDGGSAVVGIDAALGLTVVTHFPEHTDVAGLFGRGGSAGPDLYSRGGGSPSTAEIVATWQVRSGDRLFDHPAQPPAGFPSTAAEVEAGAVAVGQQACADGGLVQARDLAACAFDVALTGDTGFVTGHALLAIPAEYPPVAADWAARWPAATAGPLPGSPSLPADGVVDRELAPGTAVSYRLTLDTPAAVTVVADTACAAGMSAPGLDQSALRLFDIAGHAVSARLPLCGHSQTDPLPVGTYHLVVAAGSSGPEPVRLEVSVG